MIPGNAGLDVHLGEQSCRMRVPPPRASPSGRSLSGFGSGGNAPLGPCESPAPLRGASLHLPGHCPPRSPSPCFLPAMTPSPCPLSGQRSQSAGEDCRAEGGTPGFIGGFPQAVPGWGYVGTALGTQGPRCWKRPLRDHLVCPGPGTARLGAEDQRGYDLPWQSTAHLDDSLQPSRHFKSRWGEARLGVLSSLGISISSVPQILHCLCPRTFTPRCWTSGTLSGELSVRAEILAATIF